MKLVARSVVAFFCAAVAAGALAADWQKFAGIWTITGSQIAPWADPTHPPHSAESKRLAGKRVTFTAHRVAGPSPLGCLKPQYKVEVVGPDSLFKGMLAEVFHTECAHEDDHGAKPRQKCSTHSQGMTERLALVRQQDNQKERQDGREWN